MVEGADVIAELALDDVADLALLHGEHGVVEGLDQKIMRTCAHRLDRFVDRGIGGDDDDVAEYVDVNGPLPAHVAAAEYAGVVTWFDGYLAPARSAALSAWLAAPVASASVLPSAIRICA